MHLDPSNKPSDRAAKPPLEGPAQKNTARPETVSPEADSSTLVPPSRPKREEGAEGVTERRTPPPTAHQTHDVTQQQDAAFEDRKQVHAAVRRATEMSGTLSEGVQGHWQSALFRSGVGLILGAVGLTLLDMGGAAVSPNPSATELTVASLKVGAALVLLAAQAKCVVSAADLFLFGWQNRSILKPEGLLDAHRARHVEQDFPKALDSFFAVLKSSPYGFTGARAGYGAYEISQRENDLGKRTAILQRFFEKKSDTWDLIPLPDRRLPNKIVLGMVEAMEKTRFDTDYFAPDFSSHRIISLKTIQCIGSVYLFDSDIRSRVASGLEIVLSGLGKRLPEESLEISKLALRLRTGIAPS